MTVPEIPNDPAGLTAEWLTWALRAGYNPAWPTIHAIDITPGQPRKSIVGQVVRLNVQYDQAGTDLPHTIIAKFPTSDPSYLTYFHAMGMYEREIRFYQNIAGQISLHVPTCYFAAIDSATGKSILLLEDMAAYPNGSRVEGCSPETARMVIQQIAGLHAYWWENETLLPMTWLQNYDVRLLGERFLEVWESFTKNAVAQLPPEIVRFGDQLVKQVEIIHELFRPPLTLAHHDYQLDNMFFPDDPAHPLIVIDWQLITLGRGALDVANFLCWNLQPAMRQRIEPYLLRSYHATLLERGVQNYTFEQCQRDYRLAIIECFIRIVAAMGTGSIEDEHLSSLFSTILARTVAAIREQSVADLLV